MIPRRRLRSLPVVLGALLLVVVVGVSEWFGIGPTGLIAVGGFALVCLVVLGRYAARRWRRRGPTWSDDAQASRAEASEAAADLADLRAKRDRGDLTDGEFAARVEETLDVDSVAAAREAAAGGVDPEAFDEGVDGEDEGDGGDD